MCGECHEYFDRFTRTYRCSFCEQLFCSKCNVTKKTYSSTFLDKLLRKYCKENKNVDNSSSLNSASESKTLSRMYLFFHPHTSLKNFLQLLIVFLESTEKRISQIPQVEINVTCCRICRSTLTKLQRRLVWEEQRANENDPLISFSNIDLENLMYVFHSSKFSLNY
jgi:hypothetical protein